VLISTCGRGCDVILQVD